MNLNAAKRVQIGFGAGAGGPTNGNVLRIMKSYRFPPAGTDNSIGRTGDKVGDMCFCCDRIGVAVTGYLYYCCMDFPGPALTPGIWMRVQMNAW